MTFFADSTEPRVFGVPPGTDFPDALYQMLCKLADEHPPEILATVQVLVATQRMKRRLKELFETGGARLLPRIGVVTDITHLNPGAMLPAPVSTLRRSLELKQIVERLVALDDTVAPASVIDLAESLALLLDEMQSEGVSLNALETLRLQDTSEHWEQSVGFLKAVRPYLEALSDGQADVEARHRASVKHLCQRWADTPPETPFIVAGSTGSRDTTRMLMSAVARLPQGALVLPGFDDLVDPEVWTALTDDTDTEDHPQYRFARLLSDLGLSPDNVEILGAAPDRERNALVSLSLNPADMTDEWRKKGPELGNLMSVTNGLSLIEANQPRDEALAIALAMRHALSDGKKVALISPDATLARRVTSALHRWNIVPDDSGGTPLHLSTSGRFFRAVGMLMAPPVGSADFIALLKHPYTHHQKRGEFQLFTQRLEIFLRQKAIPEITEDVLRTFARKAAEDDVAFVDWLCDHIDVANGPVANTLAAALDRHLSLVEGLCTTDAIWTGSDGQLMSDVITKFQQERHHDGSVTIFEYFQLLEKSLMAESDREKVGFNPDITIWGTLEARVQGSDVVILGGLNEGVWPEPAAPDPWLNRQMRKDLGLLLPERQIGLAAHDYQQAVGAPEVILSRARRSEDSDTVPSRWLNRLTNLLRGLPDNSGPEAVEAMVDRGNVYTASAALLDQPKAKVDGATRPAPAPPAHVRPKTYAVTEIKRLIRDPYSVYARRILNLRPLNPLTPEPDARLRGDVFHKVLEHFFALDARFDNKDAALERLKDISATVLAEKVPWPTARAHWMGHLEYIADRLIQEEIERRSTTDQLARECKGQFTLPGTEFRIRGAADRIDRSSDGLIIYDYKTTAPSKKDIATFDRQILIEAVMAEAGAFENVPAETVSQLTHIGLGRAPKDIHTDLVENNETVTVLRDLTNLLTTFSKPETSYIARRMMEKSRFDGDYDHLARFGEWDDSSATTAEPME